VQGDLLDPEEVLAVRGVGGDGGVDCCVCVCGFGLGAVSKLDFLITIILPGKFPLLLCPGQTICLLPSTLGIVVAILNQTAPDPSQVLADAPAGTLAR
jgi:hypothetical protein